MNLDNNAVLVPPLPDIFDRPLWEATQTKVGYCPEWKVKKGERVSRGQILCTYTVRSFNPFKRDRDLNIKSPVNGIFLFENRIVSFSNGLDKIESYQKLLEKQDIHTRGGIVIAVSENSNVPNTAEDAYRDFYAIAKELKNRIFKPDYSDKTVNDALNLILKIPILRPPLLDYNAYLV